MELVRSVQWITDELDGNCRQVDRIYGRKYVRKPD